MYGFACGPTATCIGSGWRGVSVPWQHSAHLPLAHLGIGPQCVRMLVRIGGGFPFGLIHQFVQFGDQLEHGSAWVCSGTRYLLQSPFTLQAGRVPVGKTLVTPFLQ